jgi:hypothetical protein
MDRRLKGGIAELRAQLRAAEKGMVVSVPTTPCRYDLILDDGAKLIRAQVKYAEAEPSNCNGSVQVDLRRRGEVYATDEVDLLLVYIPQVDKVLAFEPSVFCNRSMLVIRFEPPKNMQKKGVVLYSDFIW